jgi:hypothetical protein
MNKMVYVCAGHRPPRLGGYLERIYEHLTGYAVKRLDTIPVSELYIYPSQGFNSCMGKACIELGIPYHLLVPWVKYDATWDTYSRKTYAALLREAASVTYTEASPRTTALLDTQKAITQKIPFDSPLLCLWDGTEKGQTFNIIKRAEAYNRKIDNWWSDWLLDIQTSRQ